MNFGRDLLWWLFAGACGVILENIFISRVLGISAYAASNGGEWQVWLSRFIEPLVTLPILTYALKRNGETWQHLGLRRPTSWMRFSIQVIVTIFLMSCAYEIVEAALISPLNLPVSPIVGNLNIRNASTLVAATSFSLFGTGLNQELVFRGFLQSRLVIGFGGSTIARHSAVILTSMAFGLMHYPLGTGVVILAAVEGVVLGEIYFWADRNLWVIVAAHSLVNAGSIIGQYSYR